MVVTRRLEGLTLSGTHRDYPLAGTNRIIRAGDHPTKIPQDVVHQRLLVADPQIRETEIRQRVTLAPQSQEVQSRDDHRTSWYYLSIADDDRSVVQDHLAYPGTRVTDQGAIQVPSYLPGRGSRVVGNDKPRNLGEVVTGVGYPVEGLFQKDPENLAGYLANRQKAV